MIKAIGKPSKKTSLIILLVMLIVVTSILSAMVYFLRNDLSNEKDQRRLYETGHEIRNKYRYPTYEGIKNFSHSYVFPGQQIRLNAADDVLYDIESDGPHLASIKLTISSAFDDIKAVGQKPECAVMASIEREKRAALAHEDEPYAIKKDNSGQGHFETYSVYILKLRVCSDLYSDEDLLRVQRYANSLK